MEFSLLAQTFAELESTSKRLHKTHILSELLKKTSSKDAEAVLQLLEGRVFPAWDERELGISNQLALKIISTATGASIETITKSWKEEGDLGVVTENLLKKQKQKTLFTTELNVKKVHDNLQKIAGIEGKGSIDKKVSTVSELLTSATPQEAKYLIKIILGNVRAGIAAGIIRDAIVWACFTKETKLEYNSKENSFTVEREIYQKYVDAAQHAYDVTNDFGIVVSIAKEKGIEGLQECGIEPGKPLNVMLYQKAPNIHEAFETVGKPAACEYKFDGFHCTIHNDGKKITLYTRRLEDVTKQFPDVVKAAQEAVKGNNYILDAEVVGYDPKTKKYQSFQSVSQRIKRKYDIEDMAKKYPVEVVIFDAMHYNESLLHTPFKERRKILEKHVKEKPGILRLAQQIITDDEEKATAFYKQALAEGQEGMMMKNLDAAYQPGSRVGFGLKIKSTLEPLDVVVVGAEQGEGKRSSWYSSFIIAVKNGNTFVEIGRVGTGFKEKNEGVTFEELTSLLKPHVIEEDGRIVRVKPKIIIEVMYEEIQKSQSYESGYALRFPRVKRLRSDKPLKDISTLEDVEKIYSEQRGRES